MTQKNYLDVIKPEDLSIAHLWTHFAGLVLPGAPAIQRAEMRKAFYAGFIECFKITDDVAVRLTEEQACVVLARINAEGTEFFEGFMKELGA